VPLATCEEKVEEFLRPTLPDFQTSISFLEGYQALALYPCGKSNMWMKMSMEHWWTDTDRGKQKQSKENLSQCHFVHHKSDMDRPGIL
jgi:hypothetical protein